MNIINLFHRNMALGVVSESQNKECSEFTAFKINHLNTCVHKIKKLEITKRECHSLNVLFLLAAVFFAIVFFKAETDVKYLALFFGIAFLIAFRFVKYYEWFLLVLFKDENKVYYKMLKKEKIEAHELILNLKK